MLSGRAGGWEPRRARPSRPPFLSFYLQTASDRLDDSRAALERKAALYDRLAAGGVLEGREAGAGEGFEVDFVMKRRRGDAVDTAQLASDTATGALRWW